MHDSLIDTLIVGGGPAGIAAALTCVRSGLRTMIVTDVVAHASPHEPMQSLHPDGENLLWELDAMHVIEASFMRPFRNVWTAASEGSFGSDYVFPGTFGTHIDRKRFDGSFLAHAISLGVEVVCGKIVGVEVEQNRVARVQLQTGVKLAARFFLDGSGRQRALVRHLIREQDFYSPPMLVRTGVMEGSCDAAGQLGACFSARPRGWLWTTMAVEGFFTWTKLFLPDDRGDQELHELTTGSEPSSVRTANARWTVTKMPNVGGFLPTGEASGYLDPAWGQGILHALTSGILAARISVASLSCPNRERHACEAYERWRRKTLLSAGSALRDAYRVSGIDLEIPVMTERA